VDARDKPGHDELSQLSQPFPCDTGIFPRKKETAGNQHDRLRSRTASYGERTAVVRGFRARRTLRDPEPDPDLGGVCRVPDRSGDTHPIHYDVEYCRARGMPDLLAHGFQTLVHTAPGAGLFPYIVEESLVGFLEQSSKFLKPVYAGDTIYPALEVIELVPGRTTGVVTLRSTVFNQRKELVLEGMQKFLIRRRPAS